VADHVFLIDPLGVKM